MDAARTALRLGAEHVYVLYRRSRVEMPARDEEIANAEDEGIDFRFLTNPTRVIGDERGWVRQVECLRMALGEPDSSGRRRPVPMPGTEFTIDIDVFIVAIGNGANPLVSATTPDVATNRYGYFEVTAETMATSKPGVYAAGDIVTGSATVIRAMGGAKIAARAIGQALAES
jgi:glutamate synthase (NADPH/NADH) small chain